MKNPPERDLVIVRRAGNDSVLSDYALICVRVSLFLNYCNAHTLLLFLMSQ